MCPNEVSLTNMLRVLYYDSSLFILDEYTQGKRKLCQINYGGSLEEYTRVKQ